MSTSSVIAFMENEEKFISVTCNWDGYPDYVGRILCKNYNTPDKIKKLLSYGNMSSIGKEIGDKHDFINRPEDVCTFYDRDRNENGQEAKIFKSFEALKSYADWDYLYIFVVDKWMCFLKDEDKSHELDKYRNFKEEVFNRCSI